MFATFIANTISSSKHLRLNEKSSTLWHKCLSHISRQRMERLVKDEILPDLDFSYFDTCVDYIKGKLTCVDYIKGKLTSKIRNAKIDRCIKLLRVIHTDICGPFTPLAMVGYKYFITFIDDYSRYGFVGLIREKSESLEAFKAKVELQQGKRIKVVYSDKRGEYYGRYDETGRNPRPFARYLLECM